MHAENLMNVVVQVLAKEVFHVSKANHVEQQKHYVLAHSLVMANN